MGNSNLYFVWWRVSIHLIAKVMVCNGRLLLPSHFAVTSCWNASVVFSTPSPPFYFSLSYFPSFFSLPLNQLMHLGFLIIDWHQFLLIMDLHQFQNFPTMCFLSYFPYLNQRNVKIESLNTLKIVLTWETNVCCCNHCLKHIREKNDLAKYTEALPTVPTKAFFFSAYSAIIYLPGWGLGSSPTHSVQLFSVKDTQQSLQKCSHLQTDTHTHTHYLHLPFLSLSLLLSQTHTLSWWISKL